MAEHFMQHATARMKAKGTKGLFKRQAERHGMTTAEWAHHEENSPNPKQRQRANFAEVGMRLSKHRG
jgi:hypothetical protein